MLPWHPGAKLFSHTAASTDSEKHAIRARISRWYDWIYGSDREL